MKKKNIFSNGKWLIPLLSLSILSSCSKNFLDVVPVDRIPKEQFYKTAADLNTAVYGCYSNQRAMYTSWELALFNLEETRSDNTNEDLGRQAEHKAVDNFSAAAGNTSIFGFWSSAYDCINVCNAVIDRAPTVQMDATLKNQYTAEALFIRAQAYFLLVQDYGAVPLRLHETVSLSGDNNLARSSVDSVYLQIFTDLQTASANLPPNYSGADIGRATSYAAFTLLGKAYLQHGDNVNAAAALKHVVAAGSPYSLLPEYADLWNPANKNSAESIFEIQFLPPLNGAPFWNDFASPLLNVPGGSNGNTSPNTPTKDLIEAYEANDARYAASIAFDAAGTPYILKYKDAGVQVGNDASTDFPVLRYADALLMLAEALGESTESYGYINQVRDRADLGPISAATPGTFIDKIMHERQVEFAFECQRWHDLLRLPQAEALAIMNANLAREFPSQNIVIDAHNLLAPLPNTEGQTNNLVVQNPGYTPF